MEKKERLKGELLKDAQMFRQQLQQMTPEEKKNLLKEAMDYCVRHKLITPEELKRPSRDQKDAAQRALKMVVDMHLHKRAHPEAE